VLGVAAKQLADRQFQADEQGSEPAKLPPSLDGALRLLISGGASGGHVTAALAVAEAFRRRHPKGAVLLVGRTGKIETQLVPAAGFELRTIRVWGLDRDAVWKNFALPAILPWALARGLWVLDGFRPDVVLGVGAHAMVPCLAAARGRGIPYVLQVSEPRGLANQMLRSDAAAACVSFAADVAGFPTRQTVVTGYPIRQGFSRRTPHVPPRRLLVMGGSLGSRRLNEAVWGALDGLLARFDTVVHLTGGHGERAGRALARPGYWPISTTADVAWLMAEADLVVCRAGLGTCAEVLAVGLPAIVIPGTFGGAHQEPTARRLEAAGAAACIADEELSGERLLRSIDDLTPERLHAMARAAAAMALPDAARQIVEVVEQVAATPRLSWPVVRGDRDIGEALGEVHPSEVAPHLQEEVRAEVVSKV
jgi:UDP-N-acetylglucosamine--N-acetylmuramyl-(pentapeptide) pyrophosphoryl-undecaprenol N-acetylglucosamine transferase